MALTIEQMRADIAAMIHEDPEEIGFDDNLMDLGLDSMRLLNLILKWQEAGVDLDFGDYAERFTLSGWWEAVEALLAGGVGGQDAVARALGVTQQAVSKRLRAAMWAEEAAARPALARLLTRAAGAAKV